MIPPHSMSYVFSQAQPATRSWPLKQAAVNQSVHGSRTHDLVNIVIGQDEPISESRVLTNAIQNRTALETVYHVLLAQRQFVVERLHLSTFKSWL